jgi:hypothetical protein
MRKLVLLTLVLMPALPAPTLSATAEEPAAVEAVELAAPSCGMEQTLFSQSSQDDLVCCRLQSAFCTALCACGVKSFTCEGSPSSCESSCECADCS